MCSSDLITVDDIKKWAKPHKLGHGKQTLLETSDCLISIVGGARGLYGDFETSFEVAIMFKKNKSFITNVFIPGLQDDVAGYLTVEELENVMEYFSNKKVQVL